MQTSNPCAICFVDTPGLAPGCVCEMCVEKDIEAAREFEQIVGSLGERTERDVHEYRHRIDRLAEVRRRLVR